MNRTTFVTTSVAVACLVHAAVPTAAAQPASRAVPFAPSRPLSEEYVPRSNADTVQSFRLMYAGVGCTAKQDNIEFYLRKNGAYYFEIHYRYVCDNNRLAFAPAYHTFDYGRFALERDRLVLSHDAAKDQRLPTELLGAHTWTFDHRVEFLGIQDVKEQGDNGRPFEALVLSVSYQTGPRFGPRSNSVIVLVPDQAKRPVSNVGPMRRRDSWPAERAWMPAIRLAELGASVVPDTAPEKGGGCHDQASFPDTLVLVNGPPGSKSGRGGWLRIAATHSAVAIPLEIDTVPMHFGGLRCGTGGEPMTVLLERFGRRVEVDTSQFSVVTADGDIADGAFRFRADDGTLAHAMLKRTCRDPERCTVTLEPAEPLAWRTRAAKAVRVAEELRLAAERNAKESAAREEKRLADKKIADRKAAAAKDQADRKAAKEEATRRADKTARFQAAGATDAELEAAMDGRVLTGMSQKLVREILGAPTKETKRVTELGTFVLWVYSTSTIEFSSGKVSKVR